MKPRPTRQITGSLTNSSKGNLKVTRDEFVILGLLLPYLAMVLGMALMFGFVFLIRLGIWVDDRWLGGNDITSTTTLTGLALISGAILCFCAYRFYGQRKAELIREHALLTVFAGHYWFVMALWDDAGDWMFGQDSLYAWLFGCVIIGLSWCIRKWAKGDGEDYTPERENVLAEIGLGESYLHKPEIEGEVTRTRMQLAPGVTPDKVKGKRAELAGLAGKPRARVHVREVPDGREDQVDVLVLNREPFKLQRDWAGAWQPGENIAAAIQYATYEDLARPDLFLAGRGGGSSQHFLCMGMSGTGKSKCWQCIYGTVLSRREVSVVYGDPAKGMQTGGPLAEGLAWFADTFEKCMAQVEAVERVIRDRTDYLTSRGLDHWMPGCGINFLIYHIEEAARFAKVGRLVELVEAARSAGIMLVLSLQRAAGTRMKTDVRFNLGGAMCFGCYGVRDAEFGLSEYTRQAGAIPHHWQDRYPSRHYLEASGIDPRRFAMALESDWIRTDDVRDEVRAGATYRTPMDDVTARALGPAYAAYVREVETERTNWQMLYRQRDDGLLVPDEDDESPTIELPVVPGEPAGNGSSERAQVSAPNAKLSKAEAEDMLWTWLSQRAEDGLDEISFSEIRGQCVKLQRSPSWVNNTLGAWVSAGRLRAHARHGWWHTPTVTDSD